MLEIILLIAGIVYAVKRPKLKRLTAGDYPDADPAKFAEWKRAQLKATDVFLWATWGAFALKIIFVLLVMSSSQGSANEGVVVIIFVGWFIALIIAAVLGSRAKKLRLAAGIQWPRKS